TAGSSQTLTAPPVMRVAQGNYSLWAANERRQCSFTDEFGTNSNSNNSAFSRLFASANDPGTAALLKAPGDARNHELRARVCNHALNPPQNLEHCRAYGASSKPEGVLQARGLHGSDRFGLMTGSFGRNKSGGVLRKRIASMAEEVNAADGTFIALPAATPGLVKALNALRIWGYGYDDGTYLAGGDGGAESCTFQLTEIVEGRCASWGNPLSEIYLEALRYLVSPDRRPTSAFLADDRTYLPGLIADPDWTQPSPAADGSLPRIFVLSVGVASYDNDRTDPDFTSASAAALTRTIGESTGENLEGGHFLAGRSGTAIDEFCTSKRIDGPHGLGDVYGLCPDAPTMLGSYHVAGLAHYAHTEDLIPELPEKQTVDTYALALASTTPVISIPVGGNRTVEILPAYRLRKGGNNTNEALNNPTNDGGGALVDFKIVRPHTEVSATDNAAPAAGTGIFSGLFYVAWEDSEQGGDYDQDMWGTIEYRLDTNAANEQLTVTTTAVTQSTSIAQLFGFITSGTTRDGFHAYSGILGANYTDPAGVRGCTNCRAISEGGTGVQTGAQSATFTLSTTGAAALLESPLYYAAKWGGFNDSDDNQRPDFDSEWDVDGDGLPDGYAELHNPAQLRATLDDFFATIAGEGDDHDGDGIIDDLDPDDDNDGMPDAWETLYGLNPLAADDADDDADDDGRTNLDEYELGSDPTVIDDPLDEGYTRFDFEDATTRGAVPIDFWQGTAATPASLLDDLYAEAGLVVTDAVLVEGGRGHAPSGSFMLAGVRDGALDYTAPLRFHFVSPAPPHAPMLTRRFSLWGDRYAGSGNAVTLQAYRLDGSLLTEVTTVEGAGATRFTLATDEPFHSVVVVPQVAFPYNSGIGFDLVTIGPLETPANEPEDALQVPDLPPWAIVPAGLSLALLAQRRLRRRAAAND
ncbi:MAG: hypothetical protein AB7I32_09430, partial [Gammaproteobacteria bacterium]